MLCLLFLVIWCLLFPFIMLKINSRVVLIMLFFVSAPGIIKGQAHNPIINADVPDISRWQ